MAISNQQSRAYSGIKHLPQSTGMLGKWYALEARAAETVLEERCFAVRVTLIDNEQPT
jgi:hypothetical protein